MTTTNRVILLACGSFNPITNMHLRMFEVARDYLQRCCHSTVVGGIISPVNDGYGKKGLVSAKHRCAMVNLALKNSDWIRLDVWESNQEQWVETRKVLEHFQNLYDGIANGNNCVSSSPKRQKVEYENDIDYHGNNESRNWDLSHPVKIKLLCGADLLESFGVPGLWKEQDIDEIVGKYGLVVVTRQGCDPLKFVYESDVLTKHQRNIHIVTEWIVNEISSTKIRRALSRGESVKYLLQDSVIQYINKHGLYTQPEKE